MKLLRVIFLFLFFVPTFVQSQSLTLLKGKITSQIKELNDVYVSNLRSETNTVTDTNGNFSMFVKVGDTIQFSGLQVDTKKIVIDENDNAKKLYVLNLQAKVIPLKEVEIKLYPNINAVSLGILQKPAKKYTPAERKLKTASALYPTADVGLMMGGSIGLDPIINAISGRTAMLKKELQIEKKEFLLQKIDNMFKEEYFTENLKIPKDYVRGFCYYAVEDPKLIEALLSKNKMMARFIFSDIATQYLILLNTK
jgi:hypothetical protein